MHQYYGNMENENIKFIDESGVLLSQCSDELRAFVTEKIIPQITLNTVPDSWDEKTNRPVSYTLTADGVTIRIVWIYIYEDSSSWACSDYQLFIVE